MKWIPTKEKSPNKQGKYFCTRDNAWSLQYDWFTSANEFYPEETDICGIKVKGFIEYIYHSGGDEEIEELHPTAWAEIPEFNSSDWIKVSERLPGKKYEYIYVLLEKEGRYEFRTSGYYPKGCEKYDYEEDLNYEGFCIYHCDFFDGLGNWEKLSNVVAWMEEPTPYVVPKPEINTLKCDYNWRNNKPYHFCEYGKGFDGVISFIEDLKEYAKEIPVTHKICVYNYGIKNRHDNWFEIDIIPREEHPKDYIDGKTDIIIYGRKLVRGHHIDDYTYADLFCGEKVIIKGVLTPRDEAEKIYDRDFIDMETYRWLTPSRRKQFYFTEYGKRKQPSKAVAEYFKINSNCEEPLECKFCKKENCTYKQ